MNVATMEARLLGPLELSLGHGPIRLGPTGQRAVLARLLLDANRTVPVDRLIDDLWGEAVPSTAVKMVHIYVSKLRKLLPAGVLVTRPPGYAVEISPEAMDVVRFERLHERGRAQLAAGSAEEASRCLRDALELWRGPALAEFGEPFAAPESARLEELHLTCLEDRIDADQMLGLHGALVAELEPLVQRHPLRERLRSQQMLALYRSGRQVEALGTYRQLRQTLSRELGLEPSRALRELERRMLQQDATLEFAPDGHARSDPLDRWPARAASPRLLRASASETALRCRASQRSMRSRCASAHNGRKPIRASRHIVDPR